MTTTPELPMRARPVRLDSAPPAMLPREHGAYGQLAFPLVTALLLGRATAPALLITAGAIAAFVAHEPLLVATGRRGHRALRAHGALARRRLATRGLAALALGAAGLWLAPPLARVGALCAAALAALFAAVLASDRARTTAGEVVASTALSAAALPVALAGGMSARAAVTLCASWALVSGLGNAAVRGVIARARAGGSPREAYAAALAGVITLAGVAALSRVGLVAPLAPVALAPVVIACTALALSPPSPRRLRVVGWTLMATSVLTAVALGVALR